MPKKKTADTASEQAPLTEAAVEIQAETQNEVSARSVSQEETTTPKDLENPTNTEPINTEPTNTEPTNTKQSSEEQPESDLQSRLAEIEAELTAWKEKTLRLAAEYDNYRKRTQKERENLYAGAVANTAEKFLPVYDNLERALKLKTEDAAYYKGVELIQTGLLAIFEKLHICPIEALGQPFDPALHDAVMHTRDDSGEENIVAEVFQTGFMRDGQVIRYAMVKVKN